MTIPHGRAPTTECQTSLKIAEGVGVMICGGCSPAAPMLLGSCLAAISHSPR